MANALTDAQLDAPEQALLEVVVGMGLDRHPARARQIERHVEDRLIDGDADLRALLGPVPRRQRLYLLIERLVDAGYLRDESEGLRLCETL